MFIKNQPTKASINNTNDKLTTTVTEDVLILLLTVFSINEAFPGVNRKICMAVESAMNPNQVEVAFLLPWATVMHNLNALGFYSMLFFLNS